MTVYANWVEFRGRDGALILQRAEDISTILETVVPLKTGEAKVETYLLLRNNNKVAVAGETKETVLAKLRSCTGTIMSVIERPADEEFS